MDEISAGSVGLYDRLAGAPSLGDPRLDAVRLAAFDRARDLIDLLDRQRWCPHAVFDGWASVEAMGTERSRLDERLGRWFDEADDEHRRAAAICLLCAIGLDDTGMWKYVDELAAVENATGWTVAEVAVLLRRVAQWPDHVWPEELLPVPLAALETLAPNARVDLQGELGLVINGLVSDPNVRYYLYAKDVRRLRFLLRIRGGTALGSDLPDHVLPPLDNWSRALRRRFGKESGAHSVDLARHAAELSAPRPSRRWRRRCVELLANDDARDLARYAVRELAGGEPGPVYMASYLAFGLVDHVNGDIARGLLWAAALTGGEAVVADLVAVALRTRWDNAEIEPDLRLAGAAINALGDMDDPAALDALWRFQATIRHRALRKQLDAALEATAERRGITRGRLIERAVPACGLDPDGTKLAELGDHRAVVAVEDATTVRLSFVTPTGRTVRSVPAAVKRTHAGEVEKLRALVTEVHGTLGKERARIEGLLSADHTRSYEEWKRYYRDHPISGAIGRGLIWELDGTPGLPDGDGFVGADGAPLPVPDERSPVRLWHPIRADVETVRAWRELMTERRMRQPFKQAFREIYLLTPAEVATGVYSNRFAAHIVRYQRLYALFKRRGWQSNYLGNHDGGYEGEAHREFAEGRWRAWFHCDRADEDGSYEVEYAATDQVRFDRGEGRRWQEARLEEVPAVVFSEAMRDVDLFVAVTSIAADPEWIDHGADRYRTYWRQATFGALPESAAVRRDALRRILPRTTIADWCSIDDRYLVVRGGLRTYKIHLGSGNILMEPDDSYLCIVPSRRGGPGSVYLPFEEDRLSLILSKAFLLAADDEITDETILYQIRRGA